MLNANCSIPYSLFPIPYSLFPIPYSLFPIPKFSKNFYIQKISLIKGKKRINLETATGVHVSFVNP
ncbi:MULTISPECIES: hypothetical protein [unclassified Moorena]|uniref:hypothetical protein n=1 Tax=unclassified Moorena TaxID=2683338 RepID=UPI0013CDAE1C|nr:MULTISPECIES: hypothetical protein [unclassified Moorena]NEO19029.1 hypothetical protein [Moorena sp. SIO4A5]NEP26408.1 hypothetical protein [Moorena sp. SIO3I6]NEQ56371.1 hypothetical protein [Moorena sp. SIO4A1]